MLAAFLLFVALSSRQSPAEPAKSAPSGATVDPKLHADTLKLVEVSGVRKRIEESWPKIVADGSRQLLVQCPACKPEFRDEWSRRMLARLNTADFVAVYVDEYEKYLSDDDVLELMRLQPSASDGHPPQPSEGLKEKLTKVMPSLMGEVMGRCTQIGAKLGAEVASEISKEHPEWVGTPAAAAPKP